MGEPHSLVLFLFVYVRRAKGPTRSINMHDSTHMHFRLTRGNKKSLCGGGRQPPISSFGVLLGKCNNQLETKVRCRENVVLKCGSERPVVCSYLKNSWDHSWAVCQPVRLPAEASVSFRLARYNTDSLFWTLFSPLRSHSMLLIWFPVTGLQHGINTKSEENMENCVFPR